MGVGDAADDLFALKEALGDLRGHQVEGVVLADGGHGVAVLDASLTQYIGVGGVAHKGVAAEGVVVEGVQTLELFRVLFDDGDFVADALQVPHQRCAHLVAADYKNVHEITSLKNKR